MKNNPEVAYLISELSRILGNKPYLHQIKEILNKEELTPQEKRAISLLTQDLRFHEISSKQKINRSRLGII